MKVCVGARVMLTRNIDKSARLANGQRGSVLGWSVAESTVWVKFDDSQCGHVLKTNGCPHGPDAVPITPAVASYDGRQGKTVVRTGLPLVSIHSVIISRRV